MKRMNVLKWVLIIVSIALFETGVIAQVPQGISYQAVIRNDDGDLVQSATVGVKVSIIKSGKPTVTVYSETHAPVTNENGLISIVIGEGRPVFGTFEAIEWYQSVSTFSIKVETDPNGGINYSLVGVSPIYTIPFSYVAQEADTVRHEGDPIFSASPARFITSTDVVRWNSPSLNVSYEGGRSINAIYGPVEINGRDGFISSGTFGSGYSSTIVSVGTKMIWCPKKSAFRLGTINGSEWDEANVGNYSIAMGLGPTASGERSVSFGRSTNASGENSTAIGSHCLASGDYSVAIGSVNKSTSNASISIGYRTEANGKASVAMGDSSVAGGDASFATGHWTLASEDASTAMGAYTTASGLASTAMGALASTNGQAGSFVIGDASTYGTTNAIVSNSSANQMMMRFSGGYQLYTNNTTTTGVSLSAGGGSWASISDSTKKENFQKADGEYFLKSLSKLKLGSWNYKRQDSKSFRHYGPMAQEVFHYFGNDGVGTIGCDTTLASADMDGIMMICLQALEYRTNKLEIQNRELAKANQLLKQQIDAIQKMVENLAVIKNDGSDHQEVANNK